MCWSPINLHTEVSGFKLVNCDKKQSPEEEGAMASVRCWTFTQENIAFSAIISQDFPAGHCIVMR